MAQIFYQTESLLGRGGYTRFTDALPVYKGLGGGGPNPLLGGHSPARFSILPDRKRSLQ